MRQRYKDNLNTIMVNYIGQTFETEIKDNLNIIWVNSIYKLLKQRYKDNNLNTIWVNAIAQRCIASMDLINLG